MSDFKIESTKTTDSIITRLIIGNHQPMLVETVLEGENSIAILGHLDSIKELLKEYIK